MNTLPDPAHAEARTREHLRLLAIFHYIAAGFALLGLLFLAAHYAFMHAMMTMPEMQHAQNPPPKEFFAIFVWFYVVFGAFVIAAGVLNLLAARNLRRHRGRTFCLVVAALNCLNMPFGTVLGVFTLIILSGDPARRLFERAEHPETTV